MINFIKAYIVTVPVFLGIDFIWLAFIARKLYAQQIGSLLTNEIKYLPALLFYLLFVVGLVIFVILPAFEKGSLLKAILLGALFGLITYATYDLTNLSTLRNWPIAITIIDLIWGTVLSALVSTISFLLLTKLHILN